MDRFYGGVRFTDDFLDLLDRYYVVIGWSIPSSSSSAAEPGRRAIAPGDRGRRRPRQASRADGVGHRPPVSGSGSRARCSGPPSSRGCVSRWAARSTSGISSPPRTSCSGLAFAAAFARGGAAVPVGPRPRDRTGHAVAPRGRDPRPCRRSVALPLTSNDVFPNLAYGRLVSLGHEPGGRPRGRPRRRRSRSGDWWTPSGATA